LGVDRISDLVCNILKHRFVVYTQAICLGLGTPAEDVRLNNSGWTAQGSRWKHARVPLPKSPAFDGAILLAPKRFLKDIPRVTAEGFWTWATQNENETLHFELNYDLGESLTRRERALRGRKLARQVPDILENYVIERGLNAEPYDVDADPNLLVGWDEAGRQIARATTVPPAPLNQDQFEDWLMRMAYTFKTAVEHNGLWTALWDDPQSGHYGPPPQGEDRPSYSPGAHGWSIAR
jgi:hypothetical protein